MLAICFHLLGIDNGVSQSPFVKNGVITAKIGAPVYIVDGFSVTLVCNVTKGDPPISISWLHNGMPSESWGNVSTITVTNATDGDVFTCIAQNKRGFDAKRTEIYFLYKKSRLTIVSREAKKKQQ